jgi:hypothetical protein
VHRRNVRKLYTAQSMRDLSVCAVGKRPAVFEFDELGSVLSESVSEDPIA